MALLATCCIADTSVSLHSVIPLTKGEPVTYLLSFLDLPTSEREDLVYMGEAEALTAFAAWIVCDEPGSTVPASAILYHRLKRKGKFLP